MKCPQMRPKTSFYCCWLHMSLCLRHTSSSAENQLGKDSDCKISMLNLSSRGAFRIRNVQLKRLPKRKVGFKILSRTTTPAMTSPKKNPLHLQKIAMTKVLKKRSSWAKNTKSASMCSKSTFRAKRQTFYWSVLIPTCCSLKTGRGTKFLWSWNMKICCI